MASEPPSLLVLAPLRLECRAARRGARGATVIRAGMGPRRAGEAVAAARSNAARAVAVVGFCGALDPALEPGELVVAEELRGAGEQAFRCHEPAALVSEIERAGVRVRSGPIVSVQKPVRGRERARLAADGSIAVDMESAWLAEAAAGRPFAALRAVVDTPSRELVSISTFAGGLKAYRALGRAARALAAWADSLPNEKET